MSLTKINNRIYVSGLPKPKHWAYLKEIGIKHIINLMAESCYNQQLSETFGIKVYHVPVKNYHPPTLTQIEQIINYIDKTNGKILIHCYAGLGRTGSVIACYFVKNEGLTSNEAIKKIRSIRFGSIETMGQEQIVHDYYSNQIKL